MIVGQGRTIKGRYLIGQGAKDGGCPIFSLRCRSTCLDHETLRWEGRGGEEEAGGSLLSIWSDVGLYGVDGNGGGDGDGPGKRDNRNRQT